MLLQVIYLLLQIIYLLLQVIYLVLRVIYQLLQVIFLFYKLFTCYYKLFSSFTNYCCLVPYYYWLQPRNFKLLHVILPMTWVISTFFSNECRGIFSDWFRFPSYCICKCYNIPEEFLAVQRKPKKSDLFHTLGPK